MSEDENDKNRSGILYLKGSNLPGRRTKQIGVCIKSQSAWMILKLTDLEDEFETSFVDLCNPKKNFQNLAATMTPVLVHNENEYQDVNEIASHLERFRISRDPENHPSLDQPDDKASKVTLMTSLNAWIKNTDASEDEKKKAKFENNLRKIDDILKEKKKENVVPFLYGEELKFPDCILLPQLYYAKIVVQHIKKYDFTKTDPREPEIGYEYIAKYLKAAQSNPVFRETCPTEKEIQEKWKADKK